MLVTTGAGLRMPMAQSRGARDSFNVHCGISPAFSTLGYHTNMPTTNPNDRAELIESIHQPWKATLGECLRRWHGLDPLTRAQSYLVIQEQAGNRLTLNAAKIAALAERMAAA